MMLLKKALIFLLVFCMIFSFGVVGASAECYTDISYILETGEITVSGTSSKENMVVIISPSSVLPQDFSDDNIPSVIKQVSVNGDFEVTLGMPSRASVGEYTVYVRIGSYQTSYVFMHINYLGAKRVVESLSVADGEEFRNLIAENGQILGIDANNVGYVSNFEEIVILLDNMTFDSVEDFQKKYKKVLAISLIQGETNPETVVSLMAENASVLGINYEKDFEKDKRLSDVSKTELAKTLGEISYTEYCDEDGNINFKKIMEDIKPVVVIKNVTNWIGIKEIITDSFKDVFSDAISDSKYYKKIKDKDAVYEELAKKNYDSLDKLLEEFETAAEKVYKREKNTSSGGGGGGGSSSSSKENVIGGAISGGVTVSPGYDGENNKKSDVEFTDIDKSHWSFVAVSELCSEGIIKGYEDGTFRPSNNITRAEFTKLVLFFASSVESKENVTFNDVNENDWYYSAVTMAASKGIVSGTGEGFSPNAFIKREDAALIVYRILNLTGNKLYGYRPFADREEVSEYARDAVFTLAGSYILNGTDDNKFMPKNNITRAEAAKLIYGAFVEFAQKEE